MMAKGYEGSRGLGFTLELRGERCGDDGFEGVFSPLLLGDMPLMLKM